MGQSIVLCVQRRTCRFAYGNLVTGSKYFAGSLVIGQTFCCGVLVLLLGKVDLNVSKSEKVRNVLSCLGLSLSEVVAVSTPLLLFSSPSSSSTLIFSSLECFLVTSTTGIAVE